MAKYVYPKFSTLGAFGIRRGGPGLGNLLFPYARALLLAREFGLEPINPTWTTVKLGTFLRGERDKRLYKSVFNRQGIGGVRKTALLLTHRKVSEEQVVKNGVAPSGAIVTTTGLRNLFKDIAHERDHIASRFAKLLRREDDVRIRALAPFGVGVHVRLGDFPEKHRVPLAWYVATIHKIKQAVGHDVPVLIASDGSDAELAPLLALPGARRTGLNAPGDLFALSASKIVLASDSTFSAWAAFLGHVPILWGKRDATLEGIFTDGTIDLVLPVDAPLPSQLSEYLRRAFK